MMIKMIRPLTPRAAWLALLGSLACLGAAQAHITLSSDTAAAGAYARVVLRVPHGCGASPTTGITVQVPAGYLLVRPMPKPGWTLTLEKAPLTPPLRLHGREIGQTTAQVRWQGGPLPADQFDEFVLLGKLDDQASGPLALRVVQTCEQGSIDWAGGADSATPAPVLDVVPAVPAAPLGAVSPQGPAHTGHGHQH